MSAPATAPHVGSSTLRLEDPRLLVGEGCFVADLHLPNMLHVAVVRSELPHAVLTDVDLAAARQAPGVVDAFAAADIEPYNGPMPTRDVVPPSLLGCVQHSLARDRVRYVGEPVAVVVAESRYEAEDAAGLVVVDCEPLDAVASVRAALAPDAPQIFQGRSNVANTSEIATGDVEDAAARADLVVEESFAVHRHTACPLETRGVTASFDSVTGELSVWGATKVPHYHRSALASLLDLPEERVRCLSTDVGGGFGVRGEFYPEDLLVPLAAIRTGRPVQWIEDRSEHLLGTNHSREQEIQLVAALRADGTLLGIDAQVHVDFGGYVRPLVDGIAEFTAYGLVGPYRLPSFRCRTTSAFTNKMGIGSIRSPGAFEASFARERLLDICAERLGIAATELRRRNLVRVEEMPHDTGVPMGARTMVYDGGDYVGALDAAVEAIELERREHLASRDDADVGRRTGVGVACANEGTGWGPYEAATVRREPDGTFTVLTGVTSMGQGHRTTLAQVAADALGTTPERVDVVQGDTGVGPEGIGTFASRTMTMAGNAVLLAATELRELIESDPDPDATLEVTRKFLSDEESFAFAASAALVEVDPELGTVEVLRYVVAADVGTVVNPMLVRGQLAGAAVQGIGGALLEELGYTEEGHPTSNSFMDYLLPTAHDVPAVQTILIDSGPAPGNPLGTRGAGEIGLAGSGATIASAVADALGRGAEAITSLPLRPDRLADQPVLADA